MKVEFWADECLRALQLHSIFDSQLYFAVNLLQPRSIFNYLME